MGENAHSATRHEPQQRYLELRNMQSIDYSSSCTSPIFSLIVPISLIHTGCFTSTIKSCLLGMGRCFLQVDRVISQTNLPQCTGPHRRVKSPLVTIVSLPAKGPWLGRAPLGEEGRARRGASTGNGRCSFQGGCYSPLHCSRWPLANATEQAQDRTKNTLSEDKLLTFPSCGA